MDDLIGREAMMVAMDGLEMFFPGGCDDGCYVRRGDAINAINSLSGVMPVPAGPQWTLCKERQTGEVEQVEITKDSMKIKLKPDPREETNKALGKIAEELHKLNRYVREGYFR